MVDDEPKGVEPTGEDDEGYGVDEDPAPPRDAAGPGSDAEAGTGPTFDEEEAQEDAGSEMPEPPMTESSREEVPPTEMEHGEDASSEDVPSAETATEEPEGTPTVDAGDPAVPTGAEGTQASRVETLNVHAHGDHDEGEYYFTVDEYSEDGRDPQLVLERGQTYRVVLVNEGPDGEHNLHLGPPIDEGTDPVEPGGSTEMTFTVDEEPPSEYWCDAHEERNMGGDILVEDWVEGQAVLENHPPGATRDPGGST